ncbi:TIGR03013 family XrtA/PEP-CTERM system glycosyltransferase [Pelagibius marinus]|uniref:TIGR03013 family XrtA/PEP-CTERM system glycosyltransferase n=1 Tax=Pelagibius marinus TaxID=2762760 RepID=UPI0018726818|nr:TIGR03013 family XrtA/PEP-CTERM system glycosyltransferase [Pelagibius marinus]
MFLRLPQKYITQPFIFLMIGEAAAFCSAFYLAALLQKGGLAGLGGLPRYHLWDAVTFTLACTGSLFAMGLYHARNSTRFRDVFIRTILGFGLAFLVLSVVFYLWPSLAVWRGLIFIGLLLSLMAAFLLRYAFLCLVDTNLIARRVLVLGTGELAAEIEELENSAESCGLKCVGFLDIEGNHVKVSASRVVKPFKPLPQLCLERRVSEIVVAVEERRGMTPIDELMDCKLSGIPIYDFLTFMERETGRCDLNTLRPSWFVFAEGFSGGSVQRSVKRILDVLLSVALLIVTLPLAGATALAIRVESPGPVFYRQTRVGLNNKLFEIIKFRSMAVDAEPDGNAVWAAQNDPRITDVGRLIRKFRIDELPQIINVIKGEMSFVGPRPERPEFVAQLEQHIRYYRERHRVKPGITGWAQLHYIYSDSVEGGLAKLQYDLYYLRNYSLLLDLFIVIQTVRVILWPAGAR